MSTGPEPADDPNRGPIWVLTGPTAAGKSALAVALAERTAAEVVSMDSMAVYRRMDIGTAKPSPEERARVPHHLLDLVDPDRDFDTARWCEAADRVVGDLRARGRQPLFCGGTPLYLMAFFKGLMQTPAADPELRAALVARDEREPGALHGELQRRDPAAAARIHRRDRRRLVRALEVLELTGRPISDQQEHFERAAWLRPCRIVALQWPRDELHRRVRQRTEAMLDQGLVDEVAAIERSCGFSRTAGAAIGYAECRAFLQGRLKDREELRNRIRRSTHRLIRRQTTWLRRLAGVRWVAPDVDAIELERLLREEQPAARPGDATDGAAGPALP